MIENSFWGREYVRIDTIIPTSDPFKKIKTRMLKQYIVGNAILLFLMIFVDIFITTMIIISNVYVFAIFIPFTIIVWFGNLFLYLIIRKHHHLLTIKKKYSLGRILKK